MYRTGMYTGIEISTFRTSLNTSRTGHIGQFQAIPAGIEKSYFILFLFIFISFVIFEFLLG